MTSVGHASSSSDRRTGLMSQLSRRLNGVIWQTFMTMTRRALVVMILTKNQWCNTPFTRWSKHEANLEHTSCKCILNAFASCLLHRVNGVYTGLFLKTKINTVVYFCPKTPRYQNPGLVNCSPRIIAADSNNDIVAGNKGKICLP